MNYRVRFTNRNASKIQVAIIGTQTENFQIDSNKTDDTTVMPEGQAFTFYWRDDGNACSLCDGAYCHPNSVTMPGNNLDIDLPDPGGQWPRQTV